MQAEGEQAETSEKVAMNESRFSNGYEDDPQTVRKPLIFFFSEC